MCGVGVLLKEYLFSVHEVLTSSVSSTVILAIEKQWPEDSKFRVIRK